MSKTNKRQPSRHSISLTIKDESVSKWLDAQNNISLSLRLLISSAIKAVGFNDYVTYLGLHTNILPTNNVDLNSKPNEPMHETAVIPDSTKESVKKKPVIQNVQPVAENNDNTNEDSESPNSQAKINFMGIDKNFNE